MSFEKLSATLLSSIAIVWLSSPSFADDVKDNKAVIIDDFRPKANRFAMSFGMDYGYYNKNSVGLSFIGAGNSSTGTLLIPLSMNSNTQRHIGTFSVGVSTSINEKLTLRSKVRALIGREVMAHYGYESGTDTYFRFGDASIGFTYQLTPITSSVFLSAFGDYNFIEQVNGSTKIGKTVSGGVSVNMLSDPLLYSLSIAYAHIGSVDNSKFHDIAGEYVMVSPNVTFSVNSKTSLNAGTSLAVALGNNGISETQEVSAMVYYGVSHRITEDKLLSVSFRHGVTGENSFGLSTNLNQRF